MFFMGCRDLEQPPCHWYRILIPDSWRQHRGSICLARVASVCTAVITSAARPPIAPPACATRARRSLLGTSGALRA
jgi:hypothetical protein